MPHDLQVVLVEPKIPVNTGSIGRLCLATGSTLHLIEPLGFEINDSKLKRAGLDYWKYVTVKQHETFSAFMKTIPKEAPRVYFSTKAQTVFYNHRFESGSYLFFGNETEGLKKEVRTNPDNRVYRIPQYDDRVRSLNLANAVSVVVYEAIRQLGI